jgi:hypothetical protein
MNARWRYYKPVFTKNLSSNPFTLDSGPDGSHITILTDTANCLLETNYFTLYVFFSFSRTFALFPVSRVPVLSFNKKVKRKRCDLTLLAS